MFGRCYRCQPKMRTPKFQRFELYNQKSLPQNVEAVIILPKNAKKTLKLLSEEGPGSIFQLCNSVPTIRRTESLTMIWKILIDEH